MQEIGSSNPAVVTGICDPNKSRARHHRSLKRASSKMEYLNVDCFSLLAKAKITFIYKMGAPSISLK